MRQWVKILYLETNQFLLQASVVDDIAIVYLISFVKLEKDQITK